MADPRRTLKSSQNARIEIRAPEALLEELKNTAKDHGRTFSEEIRMALHAHHLLDRISACSDPETIEALGGEEEAARWRQEWRKQLAELWTIAFPAEAARHRGSFPAFLAMGLSEAA